MTGNISNSIYYPPQDTTWGGSPSAMSGNYFTPSPRDIAGLYFQAKEVMKKVDKLTQYAEKHKLGLQETLDAFLDPDELELYENFEEVLREYQELLRWEKKQAEDAAIDNTSLPYNPIYLTT